METSDTGCIRWQPSLLQNPLTPLLVVSTMFYSASTLRFARGVRPSMIATDPSLSGDLKARMRADSMHPGLSMRRSGAGSR